jgi:3-mercaptopropionate dioxygenase
VQARSYNRHMNTQRFHDFLATMDSLLARTPGEAAILDEGEAALKSLIVKDDWLPDAFKRADAAKYQQYLLYVDRASRYSVQSFVWAPAQGTPIHNHTVWGLVGVMQGGETCREFSFDDGASRMRTDHTHTHALVRGEVDRVSPTIGDWHAVSNAHADDVSISIHVYGGDIGRIARSIWDESAQCVKPFVSGYSNAEPWIAAR